MLRYKTHSEYATTHLPVALACLTLIVTPVSTSLEAALTIILCIWSLSARIYRHQLMQLPKLPAFWTALLLFAWILLRTLIDTNLSSAEQFKHFKFVSNLHLYLTLFLLMPIFLHKRYTDYIYRSTIALACLISILFLINALTPSHHIAHSSLGKKLLIDASQEISVLLSYGAYLLFFYLNKNQ